MPRSMFDPVSFASLAVTPVPDVGITLIFHGLFYAEGRLQIKSYIQLRKKYS